MEREKERGYTVFEVIAAGINLEPMRCIHCGAVGETFFNQHINDAHCERCGNWQLEKWEKQND